MKEGDQERFLKLRRGVRISTELVVGDPTRVSESQVVGREMS